jgi:STE24 endopeptidase
VLEEKFGFNKQTPKLFVMDMLKGQMLAFVLTPPILAGFLAIVQKAGDNFFYYLWLFGAGLQVFMITVYPITILPLFNKLSPLQPGALKTGVEGLANRLKFPLHELYVIDGSKRSAHSNAYFFGLPWKKHIVIYDTLIEKSETEEVVAVLAHELGHWSLGHTTKLFGISQVSLLNFVHARNKLTRSRRISSTSSPSSRFSSTTDPYTNPLVSTTNSQS